MNTGVLKAIENLVQSIYTVEQTGLVECFLALLDEMDLFVKRMEQEGYQVDLSQELLKVQEAFQKKDYVYLADVLLDDVKPEFEKLAFS
ncbi:MAG: hypothetical protein PUB10_08610 [Clostridiales bacterium]|nr:hypothetical protein [Clostridiales bacterium]